MTFEFIPIQGHRSLTRWSFAAWKHTELSILLGKRLESRTWFINGTYATDTLKNMVRCQRIMNHYQQVYETHTEQSISNPLFPSV